MNNIRLFLSWDPESLTGLCRCDAFKSFVLLLKRLKLQARFSSPSYRLTLLIKTQMRLRGSWCWEHDSDVSDRLRLHFTLWVMSPSPSLIPPGWVSFLLSHGRASMTSHLSLSLCTTFSLLSFQVHAAILTGSLSQCLCITDIVGTLNYTVQMLFSVQMKD